MMKFKLTCTVHTYGDEMKLTGISTDPELIRNAYDRLIRDLGLHVRINVKSSFFRRWKPLDERMSYVLNDTINDDSDVLDPDLML